MSGEEKAAEEGTLGTDGEAGGGVEKETPQETDQGSYDLELMCPLYNLWWCEVIKLGVIASVIIGILMTIKSIPHVCFPSLAGQTLT